MKITNITILMCVFVCCGCSYKNENGVTNYNYNSIPEQDCSRLTINILYNQKVENYTVRLKCLVDTTEGANIFMGYNPPKSNYAIRGESVLSFSSELDSFDIKIPDFTDSNLYNNTLPLKDGMTLSVDYSPYKAKTNNGECLLETDSPFFFFDIDFDGEKELFINSYDTFIKGHSEFSIYKRSENTILTVEPYNTITDYVRIDTTKRLLHIPYQNIGEITTAPGYVSYRIERKMIYDNQKHNLALKNIYVPYRIEIWQNENIYKIYEVNGDTILFKETIDKAK